MDITRVIIIATPRSGSTNLMCSLSKKNGWAEQLEPFGATSRHKNNKEKKYWYVKPHYSVVMKTLTHQGTIEKVPNGYIYSMKFLKNEIIPMFDKIILLDREDFDAQLQSWNYGMRNWKGKDDGVKWNLNWTWDESDDWKDPYYQNWLKEQKYLLWTLADMLNIEPMSYERLYNKDSEYRKQRLVREMGLPYDNRYFSPKLRYRTNP